MLRRFVRLQARRFAAIALIAAAVICVRQPRASIGELTDVAARFRFARTPLPEVGGPEIRHVRQVHPRLEKIASWISAVGAAVALADLDGDGLPNDLCYVDTRTDQVIVAPVPGTEARAHGYSPFALQTELFDRRTMAPMGCLPGDYDEDGTLDLIVYYWGRTPILFIRRGERYVARELVPGGARWFTNAATQADFDGDGHVDLFFGNYFPDGARILDPSAADDASMQRSMSRAFNGGEKHLLLWAGVAGTRHEVAFREVSQMLPADVRRSWTLAVGAQDLDGDLLPELYLANDFGPDRLLRNHSRPGDVHFVVVEGDSSFGVPASKVLGQDSFKGMGVEFGDLNGDAIPDIYVSNIAAEYALEESHFAFVSTGAPLTDRSAPYVDRSEPLGLSRSSWGWDTRLADLDNDGTLEAMQATGFVRGEVNRWPELQELAMGNDVMLEHPAAWPRFRPGDDLCGHPRNPLFVRVGERYLDIGALVGVGESAVSRGIALADVDGDGDLDFAVANQWGASTFYRNDCPHCGEALELRLLLPSSPTALTHLTGVAAGHDLRGRPAIGAAVRVTRPDGRVLVGQVDGGNGHSGKRDTSLHFGLGHEMRGRSASVEIRWRDPAGRPQRQELTLTPGLHTILLPWNEGGS